MRILIVEDDPFIALDLADQLRSAGFGVIGPAHNVKTALDKLGREPCDVGVIDVHLGRETSEPVAMFLAERSIPFVTLSGYSKDQHPPAFLKGTALSKPVDIRVLVRLLREIGPKEAPPA